MYLSNLLTWCNWNCPRQLTSTPCWVDTNTRLPLSMNRTSVTCSMSKPDSHTVQTRQVSRGSALTDSFQQDGPYSSCQRAKAPCAYVTAQTATNPARVP